MPTITPESKSSITYRKVEHAPKRIPMRKSLGPDDIATELLVALETLGYRSSQNCEI